MRYVISGGLIAAALGTGLLVAGAFPAAAQVARPQSALATGDNGGLLTLVRDDRVGGGSGRSGGGRSGAMVGGGMAHAQGFGGPSAAPRISGNNPPRISGNNQQWSHNNNWNNDWRHRRHDRDNFRVGFAFGAPYYYGDYAYDDYAYEPGYYAYGAAGPDDDAVAYCMSRFQTYNTATGTYLGYDGLQHPCP